MESSSEKVYITSKAGEVCPVCGIGEVIPVNGEKEEIIVYGRHGQRTVKTLNHRYCNYQIYHFKS